LLYGSGLGVVMRQQPRLPLSGFGEVLLQHRGDTDVELSPPAAQQRLVGGVLKQRMPEHIDGVRWLTAMVKKLGLHEPFQRLSQALLGKPIGNRTHRLIRKLSNERRAGLCHLFCRTQTIEPGGQQPLQCVRNRQWRQRTTE